MLQTLNQESKSFYPVKIYINELTSTPGGKSYKEIVKCAAEIVSKRITIIEYKEGKKTKEYTTFNLIASCNLFKEDGYIEATFNDVALPYLLNLPSTGSYSNGKFDELIKLKSSNSHRIYWLLKQFPTKKDRTIQLQELKSMLMLEEKYPKFADFRKRILEAAQKDLEQTEMAFSLQYINGRRGAIDEIIFTKINNTSPKNDVFLNEDKVSISTNEIYKVADISKFNEDQLRAYECLIEAELDPAGAKSFVEKLPWKEVTKLTHKRQIEKKDRNWLLMKLFELVKLYHGKADLSTEA